MNEVCVARLEKGAWDPAILEAMDGLVALTHSRGSRTLEDELLRCDTLYLAADADGPLAFFLVARVRLLVGAELRQARYLGLSAVRTGNKGSEAAAAVYARFTADARVEEQRRGIRLVLFTRMAAPPSLRSAFWTDVQPAQDSTFEDGPLPLARAAAGWLGTVPGATQDRPLRFCFLSESVSSDQADAA